jgi:Protein of unknown function (DUF1569)
MPERRLLDFASMDQIMPDVERLIAGHSTVGDWTLAQILHHLATAIWLSSLGRAGSSPGEASEAVRRRFFRSRRFPEGVAAPHPRLIPPTDADVCVQREALRNAIEIFSLAAGPFPGHPRLGPLSKDEWTQFHCIHCAHHLGFAIPRSNNADSRTVSDRSLAAAE